ncbi:MAG TPA: enoyl-CoA hydratase/isomerase family protein [Actinomycetota bacterium]|nr:enoyl-CoA hydratase/isomerase family protein [Actinomycetota bacterium]
MALVELSREGSVATLELNRPEARNALSVDVCDAVVMALADVARDPQARVLVISGEGSSFCAGADLAAVSGAEGLHFLPRFERMLEGIARHRLPTIAAIHGAALGGGLQLATVCDFRVATSDATIGIPSAKLGILVNFENIQRLVLLAGVAVAKQVLMTGRSYTGEEAASAGLVDRAVPADDLAAAVGDLSGDIAARAPLSVQGTKRAIQVVVDHLSIDRSRAPDELAEVDRLVEAAYKSRDLQAGIRALREKTPPEFQGI